MNKYRNKKIIYDDIKFDSKKEANYYLKLKILQKIGVIKNLELQKEFILQPSFKLNGKTYRKITYKADFSYVTVDDDKLHIVDVKSEITKKEKVYSLKKKLFMYKYEIELEEIV